MFPGTMQQPLYSNSLEAGVSLNDSRNHAAVSIFQYSIEVGVSLNVSRNHAAASIFQYSRGRSFTQ